MDKCVGFICQAFADLKSNDWFGLQNLGNQDYNIPLEERGANESVKKQLLKSLRRSIEDCIMEKRRVDFK